MSCGGFPYTVCVGKRGPKPTAEHGTHTRYRRGCKCQSCKDAHAAYVRDWYARNPEKKRAQYERRKARLTPADHRRRHLAQLYGLTVEAFEEMWTKQAGRCAICECEMIRGRYGAKVVCVDHCHDSKVVRGLLCSHCNRAIGMLDHDSSILTRAADYLAAAALIA